MTDFVYGEKLLLCVTMTNVWPYSVQSFSVQCAFDKFSVKIANDHLFYEDGSLFFGPYLHGKEVFVQVTFHHAYIGDLSYVLIPGHVGEFGVKNAFLSRLKTPAAGPAAAPLSVAATTTPTTTPTSKALKKGDLVRLVGCAGEAARKKLATFYGHHRDDVFVALGPLIGKEFFVDVPLLGTSTDSSAEYYTCRLEALNGDEFQFHVDWLELICSDYSGKKQQAQSDLDKAKEALIEAQRVLQAAQKMVDLANEKALAAQAEVGRCGENMKQFSN